jgi:class 3 adenylate cyclase
MSGAPLPRGTVTFLFSDIEGSTDLLRRVGDDVFAAIRRDLRRILRNALAEHAGRKIDTAGDGFFIAFDSARSAVAAAVGAQLALATFKVASRRRGPRAAPGEAEASAGDTVTLTVGQLTS